MNLSCRLFAMSFPNQTERFCASSMNETISSRRVLGALLVATASFVLLSGCAVIQDARIKASQREWQEHLDYFLSIIYSQAPELRNEPLHHMGSSWDGKDIKTSPKIEARFYFERDGDSVYRFVRVERFWPDRAKPPKITLTIGRERAAAAHIIEEHSYAPKHK